jgi:predicted  nucleic acid-binding Zn-ribbon protein
VADFAEQFTRLEAENSQLRKAVKSSADQVLEANRLATDAKNENALLKEEVKRLKRQMKDEQDARRAAAAVVDEKEVILRESVKKLLGKKPMVFRFFLDVSSLITNMSFFQRPPI